MPTRATSSKEDDMAARYRRAAAELPMRVMPRLVGNVVDGYWLDDNRYFFVDDRSDIKGARTNPRPMLADFAAGTVSPVGDREGVVAAVEAAGVAPAMLNNASFALMLDGRLAVTVPGRALLIDLECAVATQNEALAKPALFSPDGVWAAYLENHDLWLRDRTSGKVLRLTKDGARLHPYGQQPENALAPITYRARTTPVGTWSKDSTWFLSHQVDERDLPEAVIVQHAPPGGDRPKAHSFRFSIVGDPLPTCQLVAFHPSSGRVVRSSSFEVQVGPPLVTNSAWFDGHSIVFYLRQDRFRKRVELIEWDLETGDERLVFMEEASGGYTAQNVLLDGPPLIRVLDRSPKIVWWSQQDGWGHLYLIDRLTGSIDRQLTSGSWQVREIVYIDEERGRVLFTAGGIDPDADPGVRQLCAVDLDGGDVIILAGGAGDVSVRSHLNGGGSQEFPFRPSYASVGVSPGGSRVAIRTSSLKGGAQTELMDFESGRRLFLTAAKPRSPEPMLFEALAADGMTRLHGVVFLPSDFDASRNYPMLDFVYPGPQIAWLPRGIGTAVEAQARAWAELGLAVVVMDTRGVPYRSRDVHQMGYGAQFEPQLSDHVAVLDQLCNRHGYLDRSRIGIIGSSGGGAASAYAMFNYPEVFGVGVAIAGNHDSRKYRSVWIDRYVGPIEEDGSQGHDTGSTAENLKGRLLLVAGDMDENVPVSQTLGLAAALVQADKDFDLLIVPNEGHSLLVTSAYAQRRIWDFLVRGLLGLEPPTSFSLAYDKEDLVTLGRIVARDAA